MPKAETIFGVPIRQSPQGMTRSVTPADMKSGRPARKKRRSKDWMKRMRPMSEFDPSAPAMVHDRLNDRTFAGSPDLAAAYKQHATPHAPGVIEFDGLLLDGWRPVTA